MDTDFDLRDIILEATAEIQPIIREVLAELAAPAMMSQAIQSWTQAPDEIREEFAKQQPEQYRELMRLMSDKKERKVPYGKR